MRSAKEFSSYDEMMRFERDQELYFIRYIKACEDPFKFYKQLFLETFHPKYRRIKKMYEEYAGGFWRDDHGYLCSNQCNLILDNISDGEVWIERDAIAIYSVYIRNVDDIYRFFPSEFTLANEYLRSMGRTSLWEH